MSTTSLNVKPIYERAMRQCEQLYPLYKKANGTAINIPSFFDETPVTLSHDAQYLILLLHNRLETYHHHENFCPTDYWHYTRSITVHGSRWKTLVDRYPIQQLWNEEFFPVLVYLFGAERAPLVAAAWETLPTLMYQKDSYRRSFRSPHRLEDYFKAQLDWLQEYNRNLAYHVSLETELLQAWEWYGYGSLSLAPVWQAAMATNKTGVETLLLDVVYLRHPVAKMSDGAIKALLISPEEHHWKAITDLLLSAQRQEGLRQSIVERIDEGSLAAMQYLMRFLIQKDLVRFSSVVRAVGVWMGLGWEAPKKKTVGRFLELGAHYLAHPEDIPDAIKDLDSAVGYAAIWAQGVLDADQCGDLLLAWFAKGNLDKKHLALYVGHQLANSGISLRLAKASLALQQPKLWALTVALIQQFPWGTAWATEERCAFWFTHVETLLERVPKDGVRYHGIGFSWMTTQLERQSLHYLMIQITDFKDRTAINRLLVYFNTMSSYHREEVVQAIYPDYYVSRYELADASKTYPKLPTWKRDWALTLIKDRAEQVRALALHVFKQEKSLEATELIALETLLKRKSASTRKHLIEILLQQPTTILHESTARLLRAKSAEQRLAGLNILQQLHDQPEYQTWLQEEVVVFQQRARITNSEQVLLNSLANDAATTLNYTWDNGLGLYDSSQFPVPNFPALTPNHGFHAMTSQHPGGFDTDPKKIREAFKTLYALVLKHKEYRYEAEDWEGNTKEILLGHSFSPFVRDLPENATTQEKLANYPLVEVWLGWFETSGLTPKDLLLAELYKELGSQYINEKLVPLQKIFVQALGQLDIYSSYPSDDYYWYNTISTILWLVRLANPFEKAPVLVDGLLRRFLGQLPEEEYSKEYVEENRWNRYSKTWRDMPAWQHIFSSYTSYIRQDTSAFDAFWELAYWQERHFPQQKGMPMTLNLELSMVMRAYKEGKVGEDYVYAHLLQGNTISIFTAQDNWDTAIRESLLETYPKLKDMTARCLERILEIELARGDSSTPASELATDIQHLEGIRYFVDILHMLGKETLHRGYSWGSYRSKKEIGSQLLKRCYPSKTADVATFKTAIKNAQISDKRLIEAAMYAPQWLPLVQECLGWKGLPETAWWLHAHTKSNDTAEMETEIARYSKISLADFEIGAVDSAWFKRAYKALGKARWKTVYQAAKYITSGSGHRRAQLYSEVLLGQLKIREVTQKVKKTRNQEYLRMYGLVPLSKKMPEKDLLNRYAFIQQFIKESKQFGSQKQASEKTAAQVALQNLAQIAGYDDPIRLTWAMEARQAQTILAESQPFTTDDVTIALRINAQGKASLYTTKADKILKSIPTKLRKAPEVLVLKARVKTLQEQYRRTRRTLEQMLVDATPFQQAELELLLQHPVVAPQLQKMVGKSGDQLGFFTTTGVQSVDGTIHPYETWTILAHSYDLYASGDWTAYQQYCFDEQIAQPIKQIFRALYLPTADELRENVRSSRYAGHQVQPSKTVALLKGRGWTVDYDEGLQRVYHQERLVAHLYAAANWFTPADTEAPTLETIQVWHLDTNKRVAWSDVPPRLFSELMRDVDLVVSVAHVGEVDPEASQSSVEMRAALVEQTARLFRLDNVRVEGRHVLIDGSYGAYTVHLGSALVQLMPGRALSIVAVQSQHRGRLFLPFVDDDPRSAELLSKVLLLAKDQEIQDPSILEQLGKR